MTRKALFLMRPRLIASSVLLLISIGCSSESTDSEFVGDWSLTGYELDDGTQRVVSRDLDVGIEIRPDGTLGVQHDLCASYEAAYSLDNAILATTDPVFPDVSCDGFYDDVDGAERSELLRRAFLDSQTMVAVSADDVLTVTTGRNETLMFERAAELSAGRTRFEELVTGDLGLPDDQTFPRPRLQVLRDQGSLDSLYSRLTSGCTDPCEPTSVPPVDFMSSIVVLVTHEIESTGGYGIEVTDVSLSRTGDLDVVSVDVLNTEPGSGCGVDDAFSTPFALYQLDTRVESVEFNERTRTDASC